MPTKVLLFGASGLLGHSLAPYLDRMGYTVASVGRNEGADFTLSALDSSRVGELVNTFAPEVVVNLIGATNVDLCETDPLYAYEANVAVVENIARAIAASRHPNVHLIHVSTDQLYDGSGVHCESRVRPINVYALSKYAGELAAMQCRVAILRTNFFGKSRSPSRQSFTDWLVKVWRSSEDFTLFDDVIFSALHMDTLCDVIHQSIRKEIEGVFNVGCRDSMSKAGFGVELAKLLKMPLDRAKIGSSTGVILKARRPQNMSMDVQRIEAALNYQCPLMSTEIAHAAEEYLNG